MLAPAERTSDIAEAVAPSEAALGVVQSVTGRRWSLTAADGRLAEALSQRHGLPEIVGRLLAARGIGLEAAASFLEPKLRHLLPDPRGLKDMRKGAERLAAAIAGGETVAVFGDYDVDGATASALLLRFLADAGAVPPQLYVPDRLREGYGPNAAAMRTLRGRGARVVVTVDCGISAYEALDEAAAVGLDVVVVDHHQGRPRLPAAHAVINPNRLDESGAHAHLAAVGVAFLLVVEVNRLLREAGWYASRPEPDLRLLLDLVALGTVCDVVPLTGVNRAFVSQGLKILAGGGNEGLRAIAEAAGLHGPPSCRDLGFAVGPRINAGGRVGEADLGARLLSTRDPQEAAVLARRLDALNRERQAIEQAVFAAAADGIEDRAKDTPLIWAVGEGWHPGVIGIVASRLAERYGRPALVVATDGERAVASGRSVPGIDLGAAVNAAAQRGLLLKGGGHAMAAGFTAESGRLGALFEHLAERLVIDEAAARRLRALPVDAVLTVQGAAALPAVVLATLAPFGAGHPEPRFVIESVHIGRLRAVGDRHLCCGLGDGLRVRLPGIAFRCADQPLGRALAQHAGAPLHLAGRLQARRGDGGALQFVIDDAARPFG